MSDHALTTCTQCNSFLEADAPVCSECGLNQHSQFRLPSARHAGGLTPSLTIGLGIAGAIILLNIIVLNKPLAEGGAEPFTANTATAAYVDKRSNEPPPVIEPVIEPAPTPTPSPARRLEPSVFIPAQPPAAPEPMPEPTITEVTPEPSPEPGMEPEPEPVLDAEPAPAPDRPVDLLNRRAQLIQEISEEMETSHPLYTAGKSETIQTQSGPVRGLINLIGPNYLLITVNGSPTRISFDKLETKSRIRMDQAFRSRMIEQLALRKLAQSNE